MSKAGTVADHLVERLIEWGVDTIFGFPGDGVNGIFEALRTRQDKMRFIQVRHEEAAAFAACGYAKYTGRLGVCLATSGPGGIHLLNGLYDAKCDGQPVLAITGPYFPRPDRHPLSAGCRSGQAVHGRRGVQPARHGPGSRRSTWWMKRSRHALTRRTVAHITIPKDIQEWTFEETNAPARTSRSTAPICSPAPIPCPRRNCCSKRRRSDQQRLQGRDSGRARMPKRARGSAGSWPKTVGGAR